MNVKLLTLKESRCRFTVLTKDGGVYSTKIKGTKESLDDITRVVKDILSSGQGNLRVRDYYIAGNAVESVQIHKLHFWFF